MFDYLRLVLQKNYEVAILCGTKTTTHNPYGPKLNYTMFESNFRRRSCFGMIRLDSKPDPAVSLCWNIQIQGRSMAVSDKHAKPRWCHSS